MTANGNGNRGWFQWVLGGMLIIAMAVSGYAINKTDTVAATLASDTVRKDQYYRDQARLDETLKCMNEKLDRLLERRK